MTAITNNLIEAIGWSIIHSLWQGAIIYAVVFFVFISFPKLSSNRKYNIAFGAISLLLCSFFATFFFCFKLPVSGAKNLDFLTTIPLKDAVVFEDKFNLKNYLPILSIIYSLGIIGQSLLFLWSYVKLNRIKKESKLPIPKSWQIIFSNTLSKLKINKQVSLHLSEKVNVPLIIGFFKPVILFPVSLVTQLDMQQVETILMHELAHIRRNDYVLNLLKIFIETLLFFNPFVWQISKFITIEREHACDDLVTDFHENPLTYAHALLKLELIKKKNTPALSLAALGNNQHLYHRIKRITNMKTNYMNTKQHLIVLVLTAAIFASVAFINPKKDADVVATDKLVVKASGKIVFPSVNRFAKFKTARADTDTTKVRHRKIKITITDNKGVEKTYNSIGELPDSLRNEMRGGSFEMDSTKIFFNSAEWKAKTGAMQKQAIELSKKFQSKDWQDKVAKMKENGAAMSKQFESKEWKDKIAKMAENAAVMSKKFNSKEWKEHAAKMRENAEEMSKNFDRKAWKDQASKMQESGKAISEKMNSKEWKDVMTNLQDVTLELANTFNSKEWQEVAAKMQKIASEMFKKFDSKEWKSKMEKLEKSADKMDKNFDSLELKGKLED